ncbi:MAG: hypothetical protein KF690_00395 [Bacteroidetes bacterium]|nr:hypothetical protein [Bacteroidota bacterium]
MQKLILLLLCCLPWSLNAQRIDFCANYEADGAPIGEATEWLIGKDGSNLYILFRGNGKVAEGARLNFQLRSQDGKVDSRIPMEYSSKDGFVVVDYFFDTPGTFTATMRNDAGEQLATATLVMKQQATLTAASTTDYAQAKVGFAEQVTGGQAIGVAQVFGIGRDGGSIQVFISNPTPFYTDQLLVDIWAKEGNTFSRFMESLTLDIDPESGFVFFPYEFTEAGLYRFSFFTKGETFIQHGYIKTIIE